MAGGLKSWTLNDGEYILRNVCLRFLGCGNITAKPRWYSHSEARPCGLHPGRWSVQTHLQSLRSPVTVLTLYIEHPLSPGCSVFFTNSFLVTMKCSHFCLSWKIHTHAHIFIIILSALQCNCLCACVCLPKKLVSCQRAGTMFCLAIYKIQPHKISKMEGSINIYLQNFWSIIFSFHQIKLMPNDHSVFKNYF